MTEGAMVNALDVPMQNNDAGAATIRDYLVTLLAAVWKNGADFNGKRPFGNSGWEYEIYAALGRAGLIAVQFDEGGYIDDGDFDAADRLIAEAIESMREVSDGDT